MAAAALRCWQRGGLILQSAALRSTLSDAAAAGCSSIGGGSIGGSGGAASTPLLPVLAAAAAASSTPRCFTAPAESGSSPSAQAAADTSGAERVLLRGRGGGSSSTGSSSGDNSSSSSSSSSSSGVGPSGRRLEPDAAEVRAAFEHCAQLVAQHDAESLSWVAQLPRDLRARVLALRAFSLEALLAGERVRSQERALGALRFQWWRDALAQLGAPGALPPAHPVLTALWAAGRESKLARYNLRRIVDAREEEFTRDQPPLTLEELEAHCEGTASQLLYAQLAAAGIASRDADHAASHLGKATGLVMALRGTPFQAARRRALLPVEVCAAHRVSQEELFRGPPAGEGLKDAALAVASAAKAHLDEARALAPKLPAGAAPLLRGAVGVGEYLRALEAAGFDVFAPGLPAGGVSPLRRALLTKWHALRGTY